MEKPKEFRVATTSYGNPVVLPEKFANLHQASAWLLAFADEEVLEIDAIAEFLTVRNLRVKRKIDASLLRSLRDALRIRQVRKREFFFALKRKLKLRVSTDFVRLGSQLVTSEFSDLPE